MAGSFMSFQKPSMPQSVRALYWLPNQARASGFSTSGKWLHPGQTVRQLPGGAGACVQGDGVVLDEGRQAGNMVRMLVGDENAVQLVHGQLQLGQTRLDAAGRDPGIHQDVGISVGQQQAIALRAAG